MCLEIRHDSVFCWTTWLRSQPIRTHSGDYSRLRVRALIYRRISKHVIITSSCKRYVFSMCISKPFCVELKCTSYVMFQYVHLCAIFVLMLFIVCCGFWTVWGIINKRQTTSISISISNHFKRKMCIRVLWILTFLVNPKQRMMCFYTYR